MLVELERKLAKTSPLIPIAAAESEPHGKPELKPATRRLLEGPVLPTLLKLAAPTVALMALQGIISAGETAFVGRLGSAELAGVALSFPLVMLMTTLSAGAFGGGVSSGVARALGARDVGAATRITETALALAALLGAAATVVMLTFGRSLYALLGASGAALDAAAHYSDIIFLGAVPFWLFNASASVLRARGNAAYPAKVGAIAGSITLAVSPLAIFGFGPFTGFGISGAAGAIVLNNLGVAVVLLRALRREGALGPLSGSMLVPRRVPMFTILRVSVPSAANTIITNATFIVLIGLVAPFGVAATAGYGVGGRLEFLLIPLIFGIGSAIVPMVAANEGAGNVQRVGQITRAGAILASAACGAVGLFVALVPHAWMSLFTSDAQVSAIGRDYLRTVGPAYVFLGLGLSLFFAAQGRGRTLRPLIATSTRLVVAGGAGSVAVYGFGADVQSVFYFMAGGLASYGIVMTSIMRRELGLVR